MSQNPNFDDIFRMLNQFMQPSAKSQQQPQGMDILSLLEGMLGSLGTPESTQPPISEDEIKDFSQKINDPDFQEMLKNPENMKDFMESMGMKTPEDTTRKVKVGFTPNEENQAPKSSDIITNPRVTNMSESILVEVGLVGMTDENIEDISIDETGLLKIVVNKDGQTIPCKINLKLDKNVRFQKEGSVYILEHGLLSVTLIKVDTSFSIPNA